MMYLDIGPDQDLPQRLNGEDFIPTVFRKSTYEEIYTSIIFPINGQTLWETTPYPVVLPPLEENFTRQTEETKKIRAMGDQKR